MDHLVPIELLLIAVYHKKSIWNTYQEETYRLPRRVKGITTISFVLNQKIHLKGFSFDQPDKARAKLMAGEADRIYGDKYTIDGDFVKDIGNNVTLEYADMDFGAEGVNRGFFQITDGERKKNSSVCISAGMPI